VAGVVTPPSYSAAAGCGRVSPIRACDGSDRGFAFADDLHGREREFDAVLVEAFLIIA